MEKLSADLLCLLRGDAGIDGFIAVGRRTNGVAYSAEDIAFLQAIGQMTVLALHSSRANQNLARLNSELKAKVDRIAEQQRQLAILRAELMSLQQDTGERQNGENTPGLDRGELRGNSREILNVLAVVRKAAATTSTVLIRGESGTGKELIARVVHRNSDRANKSMISVNCAALAPSLLESELFGHVRGAFTGANSDKEGRFQAADGGTLFLDEIGDISPETQVKLLRVLQERCFEPVGSGKTVHVNVRLIAATNRNLEEMIQKGTFREDLFYRLNVISITLPPLRERREDLIELVFFFLNRAAQKTNKVIRQID
ncbi:MAG: sigma 54-interacting transcriptional regulator, partial [Planctomycetaceae bacterium]|nr:sigma 54-interacting transcriptional regulator [Planctomycetaceae bacterium]